MRQGNVVAVVGAQYGSEGKGAVVAKIANDFDVHVRTGAPNAGHSYYIDDIARPADDEARIKVVARSVPVGALNPDATLYLGPGALIDLELLIEEVEALELLGLSVKHRIFVDPRAVIIDPVRHHQFEDGTAGEAHRLIGSTGEGVGPARMAHMARTTMDGHRLAWTQVDHAGSFNEELSAHGISFANVPYSLNSAIADGRNVLLEGTQGSGLSLVHGAWPYCTSTDTNASQLLTDAGISPLKLTEVILVARTFPIRVAGNSGPLAREITFEEIGVPPEYTTVTKKMRRVGRWDDELFAEAVLLNGPDITVALTFMDYIAPGCAGIDDWAELLKTEPLVDSWIDGIRAEHNVRTFYVGTGPDSIAVDPRARWGR